MNKLNGIIILILVIGVSALAFFGLNPQSKNTQISTEITLDPSLSNDPNLKEYKEEVSYKIPENKTEDLKLTVKLNSEGIVVDSSVSFTVNDRVSVQYQNDFSKNYKFQIIGKNIKDINLSRVGSASLSTKAFNEAIKNINSKL